MRNFLKRYTWHAWVIRFIAFAYVGFLVGASLALVGHRFEAYTRTWADALSFALVIIVVFALGWLVAATRENYRERR